MIFARYRGPTGDGNFTKGKTYLARPQMDGTDTVDLGQLHVVDDDGDRINIDPDNGRFDYFDEVYAVMLTEVRSYPLGNVVVADEISRDGEFFRVRDIGYLKQSILEILDETTRHLSRVCGLWTLPPGYGPWLSA